jgi:hypothetical protein
MSERSFARALATWSPHKTTRPLLPHSGPSGRTQSTPGSCSNGMQVRVRSATQEVSLWHDPSNLAASNFPLSNWTLNVWSCLWLNILCHFLTAHDAEWPAKVKAGRSGPSLLEEKRSSSCYVSRLLCGVFGVRCFLNGKFSHPPF